MKYGQICTNQKINEFIYHCFEFLSEHDEKKFVKQFRSQPHDSDQIMHSFRELVLGAYLVSNGFIIEHDYILNDKTPDWTIFDKEEKEIVVGIVELTNFHLDKQTRDFITEQIKTEGIAAVWRDERKDNFERLYQSVWNKITSYKKLVEKIQTPYIVSVFGSIDAAIDFEEVTACLKDDVYGLFDKYMWLSGVLYFEELSREYHFRYLANPNCMRSIAIPEGFFTSNTS